MKISRKTTDNEKFGGPGPSGELRSIAWGAARGFLFGSCFPIAGFLLDLSTNSQPGFLSAIAERHAVNPLYWIVDLAPIVLAVAGAWIAQGRASLDWHRQNLEASVLQQTATLVSFAADLKSKNAALRSANRAAESSSARFEQLFRGLPIAAFTLDAEGRISFWNAEAERLFALSAADVVGHMPDEILPIEGDPALTINAVNEVLDGLSRRAKESVVIQPGGRRVSVLCNTFPLYAADGQVLGAVSTATDTSAHKAMAEELERQLERNRATSEELRRKNRQLRKKAASDGLTGLKNHGAFQEHLRAEFKRTASPTQPLSMLMIDADSFKEYNDSFGHPSGDTVLQLLAGLISQSTRPDDFAARYGGEEFALLLPDTAAEEAFEVAERLRVLVEGADWENRPVTVSIGVATVVPSASCPADLVEAADRALYQAKKQGRNKTVHARSLSAPRHAAVRFG